MKGDKVTQKQKVFAAEYVKNKGNGTQAALKAYDTTDQKTACSIGTENLSKPVVQNELKRLLKGSNITMKRVLGVVSDGLDATKGKGEEDHPTRLRAADMSLKLHGAYPSIHQSSIPTTRGGALKRLSRKLALEIFAFMTCATPSPVCSWRRAHP